LSSSDFRQITIKGEALKAERLFRAAVSAFCSLTRPSRRDIAQLEDLTLPLFDFVSVDSRRYVAAALSECQYAPTLLVRRLCEETVDIAAPLLIRSSALTDIDLIALIGRHGLSHARVIGRRPGLNPIIAKLVAALGKKVISLRPAGQDTSQDSDQDRAQSVRVEPFDAIGPAGQPNGEASENARRRLRSMMRTNEAAGGPTSHLFVDRSVYSRLRDTALTGNPTFFYTALADSLEVDFAALRRTLGPSSYSGLLAAMRALDLNDEQAFLIAAAVYPSQFSHADAIRLFLSRYRLLSREIAFTRLKALKANTIPAMTTVSAASPEAPLPRHPEPDGFPAAIEIRASGSK